MKTGLCEGCGAPLVLHRRDCEYCRRIHAQVEEPPFDHSAEYLRHMGKGRYQLGFTDPRAMYNQQMQNSQGQAMAAYYQQNAMNSSGDWNQSPLAQLGGVGNAWFGRGW